MTPSDGTPGRLDAADFERSVARETPTDRGVTVIESTPRQVFDGLVLGVEGRAAWRGE